MQIMKKYIYIAASLLVLGGCSLDINENPNSPSSEDINATLIFPSIENFVADAIGDQMFNYGGFFAQYFEQMPEANQYNDLAEYNLDEGSNLFDRCYRNLYAGALKDINEVLERTDNPADVFAATVLRAYSLALVVDNLGSAPYTEAIKGNENTNPKWEDGVAVYEGILAEMDAAQKNLSEGASMSVSDYILDGDGDEWIKFANALRLRYYLRLIDGGKDAYKAKLTALVAEGNFPEDDVKWDVYLDQEGQFNPWYHSVFQLTNNHCAAYPIVSYMSSTSDPRIATYIKKNEADDKYVGQIPGAKTRMKEWSGSDWKNKNVSKIDYTPTHAMPIYFFTAAELNFLIAEVEIRFNSNNAAAKDAYEAGVKADFASRKVEGADDFLANASVSFDAAADKLKLIGMQKWVALFMRDHMEAWSEARRTDYPAVSTLTAKEVYSDATAYTAGEFIVPAVNNIEAGGVIMRVPFPENARKYNTNTPPFQTCDKKVFFDKK